MNAPVFPEGGRLDLQGRPATLVKETRWEPAQEPPAPPSQYTDHRAAQHTGLRTQRSHPAEQPGETQPHHPLCSLPL